MLPLVKLWLNEAILVSRLRKTTIAIQLRCKTCNSNPEDPEMMRLALLAAGLSCFLSAEASAQQKGRGFGFDSALDLTCRAHSPPCKDPMSAPQRPMRVWGIVCESQAHRQGMRENDVVIRLNGYSMVQPTVRDVAWFADRYYSGGKLELVLERLGPSPFCYAVTLTMEEMAEVRMC